MKAFVTFSVVFVLAAFFTAAALGQAPVPHNEHNAALRYWMAFAVMHDPPADRATAVEQSLARMTGRTVTLAIRVDPSIIGGVVARLGSTIYDGSVTTQLQKMKQRLVESV